MDRLITQLENAFLRKAAYQIVGALTRGHNTTAMITISVAIIIAVIVVSALTTRRGRHA